MEEARRWVQSVLVGNESVREAQQLALDAAQSAVKAARLEVARMEAATSDQLSQAKTLYDEYLEEAKTYEQLFFTHLKGGVMYALEHRTETSVAAATTVLLCLPGTRRFLYRRTFGRFRTPEHIVDSAEKRLGALKQDLEVFRNDVGKLQERAAAAEEEFKSGRSKLRAAGLEMQRLTSSMRSSASKAQGLKDLLSELPIRDSVRLRAELATAAADLKKQLHVLDRNVTHVSRLGVGV